MNASLEASRKDSYLYASNIGFIEALQERFRQDPDAVPAAWHAWFRDMDEARPQTRVVKLPAPPGAVSSGDPSGMAVGGLSADAAAKQAAVLRLINAYRVRGHQQAAVDPIHYRPIVSVPDLDPEFHGLTEADRDAEFDVGSLACAEPRMKLRDILAFVRTVYTGPIGAEYMYMTTTEEKRWMQARLEGAGLGAGFDAAERKHIYSRVAAAEGLERYLHTKYVGQKRFSLEGGESLIPALDEILQRAGDRGVRETVIGMAHRGRLNVLVNILGKRPDQLFGEFEGKVKSEQGSGDVKYHLGFSSDIRASGGPMHLALAFNPSHLEIANPVVEGSVKARQKRRGDAGGDEVLPVLIHGDAAFAGQGVIMEGLNMSQAKGYATGGTVHIVINNQIGFTTSDPLDARSTRYCTGIAKMVDAPILHVNGDDPEAVVFAARIALDYRMEFHRDVVLDLVCYRRHGHNEADEPAATQPLMYQKIRNRPTTLAVYGERLITEGVLNSNEAQAVQTAYRDALDAGEPVVGTIDGDEANAHVVDWSPYLDVAQDAAWDTAVPEEELKHLAERQLDIPAGFKLHPRVAKILEARRKMALGALPMDWGFAETLAYATLIKQQYAVRISGQDSERGTFFHRHAVLHHLDSGEEFTPLANLWPGQEEFRVINSVLSEEAVLAFEYGYATAEPETLVIWEAQFGDFANGAQVVIDQFITSGETKWGRLCGLVLFLPHGMEGQGPEHSSARLERYLQLCAENNIQVCVPTTPAQCFHMIRRQMLRPLRKPLVVMTPKSLLRHKLAVSTLDDLAKGGFQPVIDETDALPANDIRRIVLCSGKVYYDLLEERRRREIRDIALVRLEQLYPFPRDELAPILNRYRNTKDLVWCQEEPRNQGAWHQIHHRLVAVKKPRHDLRYAGRPPAASPAAGYMSVHAAQQKALVAEALD